MKMFPFLMRRWLRRLWWQRLLIALSMGMLCAAFATMTLHPLEAWSVAATLLITVLCYFGLPFSPQWQDQVRPEYLACFLDRTQVELAQSCELLLRPRGQLPFLQQVQRHKIEQMLAELGPRVALPVKGLVLARAMFFVSCLVFFLALLLQFTGVGPAAGQNPGNQMLEAEVDGLVDGRLQIEVQPPAYTGRSAYQSETLNLRVPQDSLVIWRIMDASSYMDPPRMFWGQDGTSAPFRLEGADWVCQRLIETADIYRLALQDGRDKSQFHRIEVVPDQAPQVVIRQPSRPVVYLDLKHLSPLVFEVEVQDDYGVAAVHAVLTHAKGSGENIIFNSEHLPMARTSGNPRDGRFALNLDPARFQLEMGDEFYLQAEAKDRRQIGSSALIIFKTGEPPAETSALDGGLPMLVMPAYFRSQRQIIIDTEYLIRSWSQLTENQRFARSNSLAQDQKLLRLRYGQFLGEEYESDLVEADLHGHTETESADERHEDQGGPEDEHAHAAPQVQSKANPLAGFIHEHDVAGAATFFPEEVRRQLKQALAQMWEAEKYLRTARPEQALPFEYKALSLIKELQQRDRVYVRKSKRASVPIEVKKYRLTGDLEGVAMESLHVAPAREEEGRPFADGYAWLNQALHQGWREDGDARVLQGLRLVLVRSAAQDPARFTHALNQLDQLLASLEQGDFCQPCAATLQAFLWREMPNLLPAVNDRFAPSGSNSKAWVSDAGVVQ